MSEWLAAFEADVAADMTVTKATKATKARSEIPIVPIVPSVTRTRDQRDLVPPQWVEGVQRLSALVAPDTVAPARWRQIVADARSFLNRWGAQAIALGWGTLDLFGAHRDRPLARYDAMGLVAVLNGSQVVAMTGEEAKIRTPSGAPQTHYRRPFEEPSQVALWELS